MIAGLERFVAQLRREGLAASPAEWLDAIRAVERVGLTDRQRFRVALRCALAKRPRQCRVFDAVFERFFAPPLRRGAGRRRPGPGSGGERGASRIGDRGETAARSRPRPGSSLDPDELAWRLERTREGGPRPRGRLRQVVIEERDGRRAGLAAEEQRQAGRRDLPDPARRDLNRRLSVEQEREIAARVPRLVERIRLRAGRRLRRASRGRLYLRTLFRENLTRDGVPFVLPYRRIRPKRSRVVLLVDVSWSAARAAGLFLSVAFEFLRRRGDNRVLLFVDRAVDATVEIERWLRGEGTVKAGVGGGESRAAGRPRGRRSGRPGSGVLRGGLSFAGLIQRLHGLNLDAPSDYGRAFHGLLRSRMRPSGRDTLLLVLGDGRTNRFDPQGWAFAELAEGCGATIWLVPEPLESWGSGDSALGTYLPHVDTAVEARDLEGLARGVSELVRRIRGTSSR